MQRDAYFPPYRQPISAGDTAQAIRDQIQELENRIAADAAAITPRFSL